MLTFFCFSLQVIFTQSVDLKTHLPKAEILTSFLIFPGTITLYKSPKLAKKQTSLSQFSTKHTNVIVHSGQSDQIPKRECGAKSVFL